MPTMGIDALTRVVEHVTNAPPDLIEHALTLEASAPKLGLALLGRPELPDADVNALYERTALHLGHDRALAHLVLREYRTHANARRALNVAVNKLVDFRQARALSLVSTLYDMFGAGHDVMRELSQTPDLVLMTAAINIAVTRGNWVMASACVTELASRHTQNAATRASERDLAVHALRQMARNDAPELAATLLAVPDTVILEAWMVDPAWPWAQAMTTACADHLLTQVIIPQLREGAVRMDDSLLASVIAGHASYPVAVAALTELQFITVLQGGFLRTDFLDHFTRELQARLRDLDAQCPVPLTTTLEKIPPAANAAVADWLVQRLPVSGDRWRVFAAFADTLTTEVTLQDLTTVTGAVLVH